MRIALVHDWLTGMRGGEYVFEAIVELFPQAEIFTLLKSEQSISEKIKALPIYTSPLQRIPFASKRYRFFLPWMPRWIEGFDMTPFDLVISSSHCVAKGIKKRKDAVHISYIHAPMRYIWDRFDDYFGKGRVALPVQLAARALRKRLQKWDRLASTTERVDVLVANSHYIAEQIESAYGRSAEVVHPFVDFERFKRGRSPKDFFLMVGAFAPNKRVDLAIQAFNELGFSLKIVGTGQQETRIRQLAGPTIEFLGAVDNERIAELLAQAKAFIFPGKEDFGITPLEAMASGTPVIAFGEGGILDTVTSETGSLFKPQTVEALKVAVKEFQSGLVSFSEEACRARARAFSKERFKHEFFAIIKQTWEAANKDARMLTQGESNR